MNWARDLSVGKEGHSENFLKASNRSDLALITFASPMTPFSFFCLPLWSFERGGKF